MNGRLVALAMLIVFFATPCAGDAWGDPPDSSSYLDRIRDALDAAARETPWTDSARRLVGQLPVPARRMRRPDARSTSFSLDNQHWATRRHRDMSGAGIDSVAAAAYYPENSPPRPPGC